MALFNNITKVKDIYAGNTKVYSIYRGDTMIFQGDEKPYPERMAEIMDMSDAPVAPTDPPRCNK